MQRGLYTAYIKGIVEICWLREPNSAMFQHVQSAGLKAFIENHAQPLETIKNKLGWVVGVEPASFRNLKNLKEHGWHPKDYTECIGTTNGR